MTRIVSKSRRMEMVNPNSISLNTTLTIRRIDETKKFIFQFVRNIELLQQNFYIFNFNQMINAIQPNWFQSKIWHCSLENNENNTFNCKLICVQTTITREFQR